MCMSVPACIYSMGVYPCVYPRLHFKSVFVLISMQAFVCVPLVLTGVCQR